MALTCTNCGATLGANDKFCGQCGRRVAQAERPRRRPSVRARKKSYGETHKFHFWLLGIWVVIGLIAGAVALSQSL